MATFREAVGVATKSAICTVLAGAEATSYVSRIGIPAPGSQTVINTIRSARRAVCDNPDPEVAEPEPPFTGGQCDAVKYDVVFRYTAPLAINDDGDCVNISDLERAPNKYYGPIGGIRILPDPSQCPNNPNAGPIQILCRGSGQPGGTLWPEQDWLTLGFTSSAYTAELEVLGRSDGEPDDCGDPDAPPIPPYSPVTISRDVTYVDNSETEITEQGDFTINAPVIIGGNIIAPVSIDLGGVEIPVELNLSTGDITVDFEGGDTPAPIDDDDDDDTPSPEDEPSIEEDLLIYGLIVYSTPTTGEGSVTSEIAQGDAPVLLLPRTGNIWFQVPVGDRVSWMGPIPVQSQNQLVLVPGGLAASGYRLFPNTGWQLSEVRMGKPPCGCVSG